MKENQLQWVWDLDWEHAFIDKWALSNPTSLYDIFASATKTSEPSAVEEVLGSYDELDIIGEVLDARELCTVGVSVNDEPSWVSISRFDLGTVVGRTYSPWEAGKVVFVIPNAILTDIEAHIWESIESLQDGADWAYAEEGDDIPEQGVAAEVFGFKELRDFWKQLQ